MLQEKKTEEGWFNEVGFFLWLLKGFMRRIFFRHRSKCRNAEIAQAVSVFTEVLQMNGKNKELMMRISQN